MTSSAASRRVRVTLLGAKGLRNADPKGFGSSDPYCVVEVPGKPALGFQTKVIWDNLDPVWDHVQELEGLEYGDELRFTVWDKDQWPKKDDFLGRATLRSEDFLARGCTIALPVEEAGKGFNPTLNVEIEVLMEDIRPTPLARRSDVLHPKAQLQVCVAHAKGLRDADPVGFGKSDPYCVFEIPGKPHLKFQTKVVSNSRDPVWDQSFDLEYIPGDPIQFSVWDKDLWPKKDELLGKCTLSSDQFFPLGFQQDVLLVDGISVNRRATLHIKVSILDPAGFWPAPKLVPTPEQEPAPLPTSPKSLRSSPRLNPNKDHGGAVLRLRDIVECARETVSLRPIVYSDGRVQDVTRTGPRRVRA